MAAVDSGLGVEMCAHAAQVMTMNSQAFAAVAGEWMMLVFELATLV